MFCLGALDVRGFVGGDSGGVTSADFTSRGSGSAVTVNTCAGADTDVVTIGGRSSAEFEARGETADPLLDFPTIDVTFGSLDRPSVTFSLDHSFTESPVLCAETLNNLCGVEVDVLRD